MFSVHQKTFFWEIRIRAHGRFSLGKTVSILMTYGKKLKIHAEMRRTVASQLSTS